MREYTESVTPGSAQGGEIHILRLYVAGQSRKCMVAYANLRKICKVQLKGRCRIEVVDLQENPQLARDDGILAIPTVVKISPSPTRRIVGDLSNTERVMVGLDL